MLSSNELISIINCRVQSHMQSPVILQAAGISSKIILGKERRLFETTIPPHNTEIRVFILQCYFTCN